MSFIYLSTDQEGRFPFGVMVEVYKLWMWYFNFIFSSWQSVLTGDYGRSVECLLQCLGALEEQFGCNSIEVANELQKISDVMMCDVSQHSPGSAAYL
jgi:hypothetical protein